MSFVYIISCDLCKVIKLVVATLLWVKWEDETPTPKVGDLESSGTPECLDFNNRGQNTLHWGILGVIGKVLNRRYRKWPRIDHLDICSPSYGQKNDRESNWQFDSRPLKVRNRPLSDLRIESATRRWKDLDEGYNFGLNLVTIRLCSRELWASKVPGLQPGQFRDCRNPTLAKCGGEAQHFQSWGLGVLRDSWMFRVRQQGPKNLALRCS
jgi:hypothetical protein